MTNCVGRTEISLCANVRLRQQKLFLAIFSLLFLDLLSNMGGLLLRGRTDPFGAFLLRFSNFTEYFWGVGRCTKSIRAVYIQKICMDRPAREATAFAKNHTVCAELCKPPLFWTLVPTELCGFLLSFS